MAVCNVEIRRGAYYDSVVLMQLQQALASLPDVLDAGVVMATSANKALLTEHDLLPQEAQNTGNDDLLIVVKAKDDVSVRSAISRVDEFLNRRHSTVVQDYFPRSVESAVKMVQDARWVSISIPGRYAAQVAHEALDLRLNVFLYSDNVSLEEEAALKGKAARNGLLVMGPDCGTAIVNGVGFGFANQIRRGNIGLIAASGTGLQTVTVAIHRAGGGITHAIGTGGRDLSPKIGAISAIQSLDLLSRDADTEVIVLISKPPAPEVAERLLCTARFIGKPVVVDFIGYSNREKQDNLYFASTLEEAAQLALYASASLRHEDKSVEFSQQVSDHKTSMPLPLNFAHEQRYLRGLFSGGTLAYEMALLLRDSFPIHSNISMERVVPLANIQCSRDHTIVDLGADEFTVGRLHPMMNNELRIRRLRKEADDPEVAIVLLDVVMGYGAHPDPAGELAPVISNIRDQAKKNGRYLEVVALLIGTEEDPQHIVKQIEKLKEAGARVEISCKAAFRYIFGLMQLLDRKWIAPIDVGLLQAPVVAINVGLEVFAHSLTAQGCRVVHVDWKPPAGGNEKLMGILERIKGRKA